MNLGLGSHPNATAGGLAGGGLGTLAIWLLNDVLHWNIPPTAAAAIAGGVAAAVLFLGKNGLRGLWRIIWGGADGATRKRTPTRRHAPKVPE